MKNSGHFEWMKNCRWTVRQIRSTFRVPTAIALQIQGMFGCTEAEALAVAKASQELCNGQVGF